MFSIRAAVQADAYAIAQVHVESWRTTYAEILPDAYLAGLDQALRTKLWQEWLAGPTVIFVAERHGRVVGFAHAGPNREPTDSCDAELYALYLLKEAQGIGIGTALLRATASELTVRNFKGMAVWVLEQNRSRMFYERTGAHMAANKVIEIGGVKLMEVAYTWPDLAKLTERDECTSDSNANRARAGIAPGPRSS
jgi:GNAT superfamily N-acetyltransferase